MKPILSVVVPTHNRSQYAYFCILSILNIKSDKFELIVSDTSTDTKLFDLLNDLSIRLIDDIRLKYFRPDVKLDMTGNHNFAISKSTGEYVCLIGDDDTITSDAIAASEWALNNNVEILSPKVMSNYVWPDFRSLLFGASHSSRIYLPRNLGKIKKVKSSNAINHFLSNAAQGTDKLPKIYHGIVKKDLLDKIYSVSGNYFFGSSPDVSGAVALSLCSNQFLEVSFPLTIPGASGGSNTGRSALNKHKGDIESQEQTSAFISSGWSNLIPHFFSVETVWAHAAIETIIKINPNYLYEFNFARLIGMCEIKHPEYKTAIDKSIHNIISFKKISFSTFKLYIILYKILFYINRTLYIIRRGLIPTAAGGRRFIGNIENIQHALNVYIIYMDKKKWTWKNYISKIWY
jgi:glycosyltransferase involved in cell wall biosynthesis